MNPLLNLTDCKHFVDTQPPSVIAARLKYDLSLCRSPGGSIPSLLVYCLPTRNDPIARFIDNDPNADVIFARMQLKSIVSEIKNHLVNLGAHDKLEGIPAHLKPTDDEFHAALKVLQYLQVPHLASFISLPPKFSMEELSGVVRGQLSLGPEVREVSRVKVLSKRCYICRFRIISPHKLYPAMCYPCGEFNIASSSISTSPHLDLRGKTALVTGGRIKLGFHVALRLLRCGASVIVSSRYPLDAETRYLRELDAEEWKTRLRIIGADFRTAGDVFKLVHVVIQCVKEEWKKEKLDILINNAAQTQVDSLETERDGIKREKELLAMSQGLVLNMSYFPRLKGGQNTWKYLSSDGAGEHLLENGSTLDASHDASGLSVSTHVPQPVKSTWRQKISDTPYEDVISTHSINAFVPFILMRELMPYIGTSERSTSAYNTILRPSAYIVNVSAREGLPSIYPKDPHKARGTHTHTNMSKAALNMLTDTQAMSWWKRARVAVNSVDPGYLSADPGYNRKEKGTGDGADVDECPIDWEDGAGRVLWPIAMGEKEGKIIRGKFLKHFVEVDARRVRNFEVPDDTG